MFPLSTVLFPGSLLPLRVFEERYREMLSDCLSSDSRFGVVLISRGSEVGGGDSRVATGTLAHIEEASVMPDGRATLLARGEERFSVTRWLDDDPYPRADITLLPDGDTASGAEVVLDSAVRAVKRSRALLSELRDMPADIGEAPTDFAAASWWACEHAPLTLVDRQALLECTDLLERLGRLRALAEAVSADLAHLLGGG